MVQLLVVLVCGTADDRVSLSGEVYILDGTEEVWDKGCKEDTPWDREEVVAFLVSGVVVVVEGVVGWNNSSNSSKL